MSTPAIVLLLCVAIILGTIAAALVIADRTLDSDGEKFR